MQHMHTMFGLALLSPCAPPDAPPPAPPEGVCYRTVSPITVDGRLDEAAWEAAPVLGGFTRHGSVTGPATYDTRARVLWDDENLYVAMEADDPDIWSTITDRDGPLWEGEVLEVYVDPDGDGRRYLEFEVSPLNTVIDLKIVRPRDGAVPCWERYARWNATGWRHAVSVEGDVHDRRDRDVGWTVEMAIALANFAEVRGPQPEFGDTWRVQFYRIDRSKTLRGIECSGWSPTDTFHRPARFGFLTFAGPVGEE